MPQINFIKTFIGAPEEIEKNMNLWLKRDEQNLDITSIEMCSYKQEWNQMSNRIGGTVMCLCLYTWHGPERT